MGMDTGTRRSGASACGMAAIGAAVLALAACGSGSSSSSGATAGGTTTIPVTSTSATGAMGTPASSGGASTSATPASQSVQPVASASAPSRSSASDTTMAELRRAHIPSFCDMKAATLVNGHFPGTYGNGDGQIDEDHVVSVDVNGDGAKELVTAYTCIPGATSWPQFIIAVDSSANTVGWVQLDSDQEHTRVTSMRVSGTGVEVTWSSYDSPASPMHGRASFVTFQGGHGQLTDLTSASMRHTTIVPDEITPSFASASGLLLCNMRSNVVTCVETRPRFSIPGVEGETSCEYPEAFLERGQPARMECADDGDTAVVDDNGTPPWWSSADGDGQVSLGTYTGYSLGYGHTLQTAWASCTISASTGVSCHTLSGAHGFTLSADLHRTS